MKFEMNWHDAYALLTGAVTITALRKGSVSGSILSAVMLSGMLIKVSPLTQKRWEKKVDSWVKRMEDKYGL